MLQGIELIDCAKANAKQGVAIAAERSGYGQNIGLFIENLNKACQQIGVNINELEDLITDQQVAKERRKTMDVAPDTVSDL
jgi:hypothetical protein